MYGEYDSARYHTSSQDEDSGNFPNSYQLQGLNQRRKSRLGKGGSRFRCTDFKTHSAVDNIDEQQEQANEDSNSISKSSSNIMNLFQETPQKSSTSPPNVFKSLNTIDRSSGMHTEKPLVNERVGSIVPSGIPFSDKKLVKPSNSLVAPECKRSFLFKNFEQKVNVLQDVVNLDNIRKTPGSKLGVPSHYPDKDHKIHDATSEKENFISQLFGTPKFGNLFDNIPNEHRFSQNMCTRKIVETTHKQKFNKIFSPDVLDAFNNDHGDIIHGNTNGNFVVNDKKNIVEEPHSLNQPSKNISYEPLDLHVRAQSNEDRDLDNAFSNDFKPLIEDGHNFHLHSNHNEFKDSSVKMTYCDPKEFFQSAIPTKSNMEFSHNVRSGTDASSFNQGKTQHVEPFQPVKSCDDQVSYNKVHEQKNMINNFETKNSFSNSWYDKSNSQNRVLEEPKNDTVQSNMDNNKVVDGMSRNLSDKIKPVTVVSDINIPNKIYHAEIDKKDRPPALIAVTKNEDLKPPISYASAVSSKPIASNAQSESQQKLPMAPPATSNIMRPPQAITKTKSSLLRTKTNGLPSRNAVLPRMKSNATYLGDCSSERNTVHEKIYVNKRPYDVLSTLGKGGSSEVFLVFEPKTSRLMAVKCVNLSQVDDIIADGYLNEVELLSKLQGCDSVIKMFDHEYVEEDKALYVVMEKGDTDLSRLLRVISKTKNITMTMIIYYWTEMLSAVKDIHDKGIIHSDLKPANFLIVCGRLKLIDFGIASSLQGDMTSVHKEVTTGTWNYMSPEAIRNNGTSVHGYKISYKSDVWSLGCILYNLVYGKTPFSHITNTWAKLHAIADTSHVIKFPEETLERGKIPQVILKTLKNCLTRDPKLRPSVSELLNYEYFYSSTSSLNNLDSAIDKMKDEVAERIKAKLPLELWGKVAQVLSQNYTENVIGLVKEQIVGKIKDVLPSDHWERILPVFNELPF